MNNKIKYILIFIIYLLLFMIIGSISNKEEKMYYKDYIINLKYKYNSDFSKALDEVEYILKDKELSNHYKGINLLAKQTYLFFEGKYDEVEKNFYEVEKLLIKEKMNEELVYLYSIMNSISIYKNEYEKSYIYIYKSELITKLIYDKNKDQENLSTLLAIKYSKCNIALDLGLIDEAKKAFEDAENLRKSYKGRKRSDIYENIGIYYYKQGNYDKAKEYCLEAINIIGDIKQYQSDKIIIEIILGNIYMSLGEIQNALEIAKKVDTYKIDSSTIEIDKLMLYADINEYYGKEEESIKNLERAYKLSNKNIKFTIKDKILNKLILINKKINNEKELLYWYNKYVDLHNGDKNLKNNQYLIGEIIDSEIINSKAELKIEELKRKNLMKIAFILIIIVIVIVILLRRLIYTNRHDALTNIYNRGYFNKIYKKYDNISYSLILFDLDDFKKINDTYGHDFGDTVLINVSNYIKKILPRDCKLFRYGGEEFIVLVKNEDVNYGIEIAENIRGNVESMTWKENITVTISVGISYSSDYFEDTIKLADEKLYNSKENGKNRVTY